MVLHGENESMIARFLIPGLSASTAEALTIPIDTAKVRMMLATGEARKKYSSLMTTLGMMAKEEGPLSLFNGLQAGIHRQLLFASLRVGSYDMVRDFYEKYLYDARDTRPRYLSRILSGLTTGVMAILVAQPTDVVKVRMQNQARGGQMRYKSAHTAYGQIYREEGLKGLYSGLFPNVVRNGIVNVAEVVTYDVAKELLIKSGYFADNPLCHFVAANITGMNVMLISCPIEVIRNRLMNTTSKQGIIATFKDIVKNEGFFSLYKGGLPYYLRIVSWNMAMWMSFEQFKILKKRIFDTPKSEK